MLGREGMAAGGESYDIANGVVVSVAPTRVPWANPTVARLATGDLCQNGPDFSLESLAAGLVDMEALATGARPEPTPEYTGLVLNCSWPMPPEVLSQYDTFAAALTSALPREAYVYPSATLHCTICTMRPFTAGPLAPPAKAMLRSAWVPVLDAARASPTWPSADSFRLKMNRPQLMGSAAIFLFEDTDGAITAMREALTEAIEAAGGSCAVGAADRDLSHSLGSCFLCPPSPPSGTGFLPNFDPNLKQAYMYVRYQVVSLNRRRASGLTFLMSSTPPPSAGPPR